ncbi:MAG: DUF262 domain-containing protein [bacterium]
MNNQHQTDETAYTPSKISESNLTLYIPIYQRLFVWDDKQINQLLEDLYWSWLLCKEAPKPYYIGAITIRAVDGEKWEVVDGQQRLTFLMLFGCCAPKDRASTDEVSWENLLFTDVNASSKAHRIHYMGRKKDQDCLYGILSDHSKELDNPHMACFCRCWHVFTHGEVDNKGEKEKRFNETNLQEFSRYVFNQTSFLVSRLPEYSPHQLNAIFEKMNSSGRQLEQDEIVKGMFFSSRAAKWNPALSMQVCAQNETTSSTNVNIQSILNSEWEQLGLKPPAMLKEDVVKLQEKPLHQLLLTKPTMLLHALALTGLAFYQSKLDGVMWESIAKRDARHLIETFKDVIAKVGDQEKDSFKDNFIETLTAYRNWINTNIVFRLGEGRLDFLKNADNDEEDDRQSVDELNLLRQFQSFLAVSSDDKQIWVFDAAYRESEFVLQPLSLLALKKQDNQRHNKTIAPLVYPKIDRYWFWRLDYYLWEQRATLLDAEMYALKTDEKNAIASYRFRSNRSIEHLHPQTQTSDDKWDLSDLNSFGNLAMISSSFNSAQSNDGIGTKFGRLEDQKAGKNLESVKLLLMFKLAKGEKSGWKKKSAKDHGDAMIQVLIDSFPNDDQYKEVRQALLDQMSKDEKPC